MKVVPLEDETLTVVELVEMAKDGPIILTRNGQPLVAVKDMAGSDWESVSLANNPQFLALIQESRRSYRETGGISMDDLCKELGLRANPRGRGAGDRKKET